MRTIILTLICHYSGMNGKVVFSIPFLLDQEAPPLAGASQEKGYRYPRCLENGFVCSMG